mgnify:CR=1 FL=1
MTKRNILAEADRLLVNHEVTELPITLETLKRIAARSNWLLFSYQRSAKLIEASGTEESSKLFPAFTIRYNGNIVILYDEELPYDLKVQIICHEFGHIILNHTSDSVIIGSSHDTSTTAMQEQEADDFATEMLAPACVMNKLGILSTSELLKTGLLSAEQALAHLDNVKSGTPITETQKLLCDRIKFSQPNRRRFTWLKCVAFLVAGFVIGGAFVHSLSSQSIVSDDRSSYAEDSSITEPEKSTATTASSTSVITTATATSVSTSSTTTSSNRDDSQSETVYVTPHGTKYHKPDCYHIAGRSGLIELTISEAEQNGYEPCKDCF